MKRVEQLRMYMKQEDIEAMLITSQANVYYMTNFYAEAGVAAVLISEQAQIIISDGRFITEAKMAATDFMVMRWQDSLFADIGKCVESLGIKKLAVDDDDIRYKEAKTLMNHTTAKISAAPKLIERMRRIKTKTELHYIQTACAIADAAFVEVLNVIKPGISEQAICNELEFQMRKRGATTCSFEIIVASGKRGALPHGVASEKIIEAGDMVTMDFGALYHHYCSDITRTVAVGQPHPELLRIYDIVKETQQRMIQALQAGIVSKDLEAVGRRFMEANGFSPMHGPGHSFGLEIHEDPFISARSDYAFEEGVVVTLEPGIYIDDLGGVRIEDDFLVTKDGCISLTHADKDLIMLPIS